MVEHQLCGRIGALRRPAGAPKTLITYPQAKSRFTFFTVPPLHSIAPSTPFNVRAFSRLHSRGVGGGREGRPALAPRRRFRQPPAACRLLSGGQPRRHGERCSHLLAHQVPSVSGQPWATLTLPHPTSVCVQPSEEILTLFRRFHPTERLVVHQHAVQAPEPVR